MIEVAVKNDKPVRIGVNGDRSTSTVYPHDGREFASSEPKDARDVTMEAMVVSALKSAAIAEKYGLRTTRSSSAPKSAACRTWLTFTGRWLRGATIRYTLDYRSRHGRKRHCCIAAGLAFCCRKASATRFAFRLRLRPGEIARKKCWLPSRFCNRWESAVSRRR